MDEAIARTIGRLDNWVELKQFERNAHERKRLTPEIQAALGRRASLLGRALVERYTGLKLESLSLAEEKIVQAVSEYVAIKAKQSRHAGRTFDQLKNRGLLGAAESAVSRNSPTEGFKTLAEADQSDISYEQIVIDHPDEFTARAIWFSRRALSLPNKFASPPVERDSDTQTRNNELLLWLKTAAVENDGIIPSFSYEEAAAAIGLEDLQKNGRVYGALQSRIDFACFCLQLPPLGLTAEKPFENAWAPAETWSFPVAAMQSAARHREWATSDFDKILRQTEQLPGQAHRIWSEAFEREEEAIKAWAFAFATEVGAEAYDVAAAKEGKRNARWSRDELILALDLYIRHRANPLDKDAPKIQELSDVLNRLGGVLGQQTGGTYRNTNGVYMKLMNFRRYDPVFILEGKKGLQRGNKDEAVVWAHFADDPVRLTQVAAFIREGVSVHPEEWDISGPDEPGIVEAEEGKVATRVHRIRERDRRLVDEAKAQALKRHGRLCCAACSFDFSERYGDAGLGIIDVHHTKPVHTMAPGEKTKVADLALLCSNCHRVVHSKRKWLTVPQLQQALDRRQSQDDLQAGS